MIYLSNIFHVFQPDLTYILEPYFKQPLVHVYSDIFKVERD